MENFARHHFDKNVDQLVREELQQAGIPILELPIKEKKIHTHLLSL